MASNIKDTSTTNDEQFVLSVEDEQNVRLCFMLTAAPFIVIFLLSSVKILEAIALVDQLLLEVNNTASVSYQKLFESSSER
jgi:hypothetical protein